ncbi:zinc ribbon domain-containing protein [Lactiplantibacillus plantarum]|uniref:zinc ribbon domain-containing protein n=1 Tax=Lactiplantibacillus plantarum TaxID=1590 RepID=UPI0021CB4325|nr:zinc ribbon domain-containing protein [Lactiplantibacillus plantarum]
MSCQNCGYQNSPHAVTCLKCGHRLTPVNGDVNQQSRVQRRRQQSRRTTFSSRFRPQTLLGVLIAVTIAGWRLYRGTTIVVVYDIGNCRVGR